MTGRPARLSLVIAMALAACRPGGDPRTAQAAAPRHLILITIDTLRADHVGAYGYPAARTPALDRLAAAGTRFDKAFAPAPMTLTSHASLLTGLYPRSHGARHNGMRLAPGVMTLTSWLRGRGFATGAFIAAFPLDRRFGLDAGFEVYGDKLPRGSDGRAAIERPAADVVNEAIAWWQDQQDKRRFLWVHLFEPHAPYGDARFASRPALARYDDEVATADMETGRLLAAIGPAKDSLVVVAGDHGEAFGEHGEVGHSVFVYDTTLRVPLIISGRRVPSGRVVPDPVGLVDVVPTALRLLGMPPMDTDGIDLTAALGGGHLPDRAIYAESFAPLLDFGWSPLRSVRSGRWKAIAAPRPELYDVSVDSGEEEDITSSAPEALAKLLARIEGFSPAELEKGAVSDPEARARLSALGYLQGTVSKSSVRHDPKDRKELAARIAMVVSGEVRGGELLALLEALAREDPGNGQVRQRLGFALLENGRTREAEDHFRAAIDAHVPSADPYLGLAICEASRGAKRQALETLKRAAEVEPGNPVILANIGIAEAESSETQAAARDLAAALAIDPDLHQARFNLALVHARAGRKHEAMTEAEELLRRLPQSAPQRAEVQRLIGALR